VGGVNVAGELAGHFTLRNRAALKPSVAGRTLNVDAAGLADATAVKLGPSGAATGLTARDIGASVLLSPGVGIGQLDITAGVVKANAVQFAGQTITCTAPVTISPFVGNATAAIAVNALGQITVGGYAAAATPLQPTVAGRTLDVSATGEAGLDWANIGSPSTAVALGATTISATQQVDLNTIKTQVVTCAGPVTIPSATLASTNNITGGTITNVTNLTNAPTAGDFTVAMKASLNAATPSVASVNTVTNLINAPTAGDFTVAMKASLNAATPTVTAGTVTDKVGYALSPAGLDLIPAGDPGVAANLTTFPRNLMWLFRRFFNKATMTATQVKTFADDGSTVNVTQTVSDIAGVQTQGPGV
jgi:hypothetical protein